MSRRASMDGHQFTTLVQLMRARALNQPDRPALTFLGDGENETATWTYQELDRQARAIAALLQDRDARGQRALLLYPPGLDFVAAFFGCLYAGAVAVPAYPPRPNKPMPRIQAIAASAQASLVLCTTAIAADVQRRSTQVPDLAALDWVATDRIAEGMDRAWRVPPLTAHPLAFL